MPLAPLRDYIAFPVALVACALDVFLRYAAVDNDCAAVHISQVDRLLWWCPPVLLLVCLSAVLVLRPQRPPWLLGTAVVSAVLLYLWAFGSALSPCLA